MWEEVESKTNENNYKWSDLKNDQIEILEIKTW